MAGKFGGRKLWQIYRNTILTRKGLANLSMYLNRFALDEKIWWILVWRNANHSPNSPNFLLYGNYSPLMYVCIR